MRLATRLATSAVVATFAVGGLLTSATAAPAAPATPAASDRVATQPTTVTARAEGMEWCTKGISECRQKRNYRLYLGCWASPIRGTWHEGWYVFDWRC
jgi:hypothetical protein